MERSSPMKQHTFAHIKTTKNFYRFQELDDDGCVLDKGDEKAEFNFGCIYLPVKLFKSEPTTITITVQAEYHEEG
jgi:hypothetical protein